MSQVVVSQVVSQVVVSQVVIQVVSQVLSQVVSQMNLASTARSSFLLPDTSGVGISNMHIVYSCLCQVNAIALLAMQCPDLHLHVDDI